MLKQNKYVFLVLYTLLFYPTTTAFSAGSDSPYNLLIVVANCLNKFHAPLYGYPKPTTPNLDLFARDAYVFKNLICPVSHTPPVIRELFRGTPYGRDFFAKTDWSEQDIPKLTEYPIGQFLIDQKYVYHHEKLPESADLPFVSFMHFWNLHFPYDLFRRRENQLPAAQRRIYRSRLSGIDEITLVESPADTEKFPGFMDYQIFGVRRTQVPIADAKVWDSLLKKIKASDDSPAAVIASGFPKRLTRRLAQIRTWEQLTLDDKAAIIRALNGFIRDPDSPIGAVLFGPKTIYTSDGLFIGDDKFNRWDQSFVTDIEKHLFWQHEDPLLRLRDDGRLELMNPLSKHQRKLLRQLYREALELILPALAFHHPQHLWIALDPSEAKAWQKSRNYENELALFRNLYDANIMDVDRRFAECLERLRRLGVLEKTVVVFMGDHGEALMEHGKMEHGHTCYDEDINPPLIIRVPGRLTKTTFVDTQLRTADVLPTVLDLMGLPPPPVQTPAGLSLAPVLIGGSNPDITVFSRSYSASRSIRRNDGWKLIWEMGTNQRELYNWKADPKEIHNVAAEFPKITAELEEEMHGFLYGK